ncbi:MAG: hypothetical protein K8L99_28140 [Anaerolineae bacterium]|nr:hypothetical protein [Anaerolineae bacterium]
MGISIIISHKDDKVMNTDYFVEQLKKKWSEVKIHLISDTNAPLLQFETPDNFWVLGDFLGVGVSYKGYSRVENVYFALWYRSIVPAEWELQIYDSALTFDVMSLTSETTEAQIIAGFDVAFDVSKHL